MPLNMDDASPRGVKWSLASDQWTICVCALCSASQIFAVIVEILTF